MIEVKDLRVDFWLPGKRLQAVRGVSFEIGDERFGQKRHCRRSSSAPPAASSRGFGFNSDRRS